MYFDSGLRPRPFVNIIDRSFRCLSAVGDFRIC